MENIVETNTNSNETNTYSIYPVFWSNEYMGDIEYIYQMYKDQERRIFDLSIYTDGGTVLDRVQDAIQNDVVFIVKNDENIVATFTLEDAIMFGDIIVEMKFHMAVRRTHWGKESRAICKAIKEYLLKRYNFKKIICEVPQCKYGVIKLLKDMGLKHEGTLKSCLPYLDKNNVPKWYDKLIYTLTNEEI